MVVIMASTMSIGAIRLVKRSEVIHTTNLDALPRRRRGRRSRRGKKSNSSLEAIEEEARENGGDMQAMEAADKNKK